MDESELAKALERAQQVSALIQGEVVAVADLCVVLADGRWPLTPEASAIAEEIGQEGTITVPLPCDAAVVITQTCDLQTTSRSGPYCQVAPVLGDDPVFANAVARGRYPGWAALPWYGPTAVADLSRITTIERSLLAGAQSLGRPGDSDARLHLAETISRHLTRPALRDDIVAVARPLLTRMQDKYDKNSAEGRCMQLVASLRVEGRPSLDAEPTDLVFLLVLDETDLPSLPQGTDPQQPLIDMLVSGGHNVAAEAVEASRDSVATREAWTALAELWAAPMVPAADAQSSIGTVDIEVLNGEELSFARSRNTPELDLAYLTTRTA